MRASKLPFRNFDYNIRCAEALARLDGYLEDLLNNQGKGTIGAFFQMSGEFIQALGMDKIMRKTEETMKTEVETEIQQKGKEHYEKIAKDYIKKRKPRLQKIVRMFEDLGLLMDQTLLEQALVAAVSAFEVYLRELAVSIIILNPSVRRKFHNEIQKSFDISTVEEYKHNAIRVQGEIVAGAFRLDAKSVKSFLKRLIGLESAFADNATESKVRKIFQTRHIIIHRAGFTDPKFKQVTKSKSAIDSQIEISRTYVLNSIKTLKKVVQTIESRAH